MHRDVDGISKFFLISVTRTGGIVRHGVELLVEYSTSTESP